MEKCAVSVYGYCFFLITQKLFLYWKLSFLPVFCLKNSIWHHHCYLLFHSLPTHKTTLLPHKKTSIYSQKQRISLWMAFLRINPIYSMILYMWQIWQIHKAKQWLNLALYLIEYFSLSHILVGNNGNNFSFHV